MKRTSLQIATDRAKLSGITYYYSEDFKHPYVQIKCVSFQFKTIKASVQFINSINMILLKKRNGYKPTEQNIIDARNASKSIIKVTKELNMTTDWNNNNSMKDFDKWLSNNIKSLEYSYFTSHANISKTFPEYCELCYNKSK